MKNILIVEDDQRLNDGIWLALRNEFSCSQAFSLAEARQLWRTGMFDLILLDVNLPDGSGMEFLQELRRTDEIPVILLTANKMEMDIVSGLELGADDYITKPFSLMVLRARVGVQLRKERRGSRQYRDEVFFFDFEKMEFFREGVCLELSRTEQRLLRCLTQARGRNISRGSLIDQVWQGETEFVDDHALTVAVNRLRGKLGEDQECIRTVYGTGYTWLGGHLEKKE